MKEQITKQSIVFFEDKGFSETSIQDIVNALGVTKGTFYYYFSSKEQLLMDIHQDYITNLLERQNRIINRASTQKEKLTEIIRLLITDIAEKGPSARVYFREMRHLAHENIATIKQKREQFRLNIENVVQVGIAEREFHADLRADMIAFGILGVTNWSYNWFNPDGEVSPEALTKIYADMILTGIMK
ncbi:TetR family transcriptional regulator [Virgibacillus sp. NKC19-16]|uniref:TetR/AcrR family transcriptional regulator n=1 Tax=Virgibacillus salidurans TaxID=2831673 RepID=UPI001F3C6C3D|nr:TetR/AcrR family transcriptional regulator [Virgibacillus sp. NKC19-16]UJL45499.1 TetR family transcriptional regulator [Virgibacillus sp. NKC19-16]